MSIPFTQYLLPFGRQRAVTIKRSDYIEAIAQRFIDAGGYYEAEFLTTGEVSFTAGMEVEGESTEVEIELCPNGPEVLNAIDRLITRSVSHIASAHGAVTEAGG